MARAQLTLLGLDSTTGEQKGLLSALQLGAARDTTTQSGGTTRGYLVATRLEQAGRWFPGSFNYISLLGDGRYLHAMAGVTLAGRVQYGSIDPMGPRSNIPFSKRYFLGGSETLRGWGRLEGEPSPPPVCHLEDSRSLRRAVLSRHLHWDGGIGMRYCSPFALFRVDFAYQFTTVEGLRKDGEPLDRRWRIHFGIGHTF